ncbi:hypothetical protein Pelo_3773 [Pelomyxa schiedti]|nr:hypothetical protein Pelo_3773 [Pelomyxa schiedti]
MPDPACDDANVQQLPTRHKRRPSHQVYMEAAKQSRGGGNDSDSDYDYDRHSKDDEDEDEDDGAADDEDDEDYVNEEGRGTRGRHRGKRATRRKGQERRRENLGKGKKTKHHFQTPPPAPQTQHQQFPQQAQLNQQQIHANTQMQMQMRGGLATPFSFLYPKVEAAPMYCLPSGLAFDVSSNELICEPDKTWILDTGGSNNFDGVIRLCQAVAAYISATNQHKIDWNTISANLPWKPNECQAIWRYLAYMWRPDQVSPGVFLNTGFIDEETDEESISQKGRSYAQVPVFQYVDPREAASPPKPKRRRKLWVKEEDLELLRAVEQFGEGNWSTVARHVLSLKRTPTQMSARWLTLKKNFKKRSLDETTMAMMESLARKTANVYTNVSVLSEQ